MGQDGSQEAVASRVRSNSEKENDPNLESESLDATPKRPQTAREPQEPPPVVATVPGELQSCASFPKDVCRRQLFQTADCVDPDRNVLTAERRLEAGGDSRILTLAAEGESERAASDDADGESLSASSGKYIRNSIALTVQAFCIQVLVRMQKSLKSVCCETVP